MRPYRCLKQHFGKGGEMRKLWGNQSYYTLNSVSTKICWRMCQSCCTCGHLPLWPPTPSSHEPLVDWLPISISPEETNCNVTTSKRIRLSGCEYKKRRLLKEQTLQKQTDSLLKYIIPAGSVSNEDAVPSRPPPPLNKENACAFGDVTTHVAGLGVYGE